MSITGTHINYYFICKRKLWLFEHSLQMEQESENVAIGKLVSQTSYPKEKHEIGISNELDSEHPGGLKIDFFDAQTKTIHEVKKSNSFEIAHVWQLLYYIYVLTQKGIEGVKGELDYPRLKRRETIVLTEEKEKKLKEILTAIEIILSKPLPCTVTEANVKLAVCKKCSYYELCYC